MGREGIVRGREEERRALRGQVRRGKRPRCRQVRTDTCQTGRDTAINGDGEGVLTVMVVVMVMVCWWW